MNINNIYAKTLAGQSAEDLEQIKDIVSYMVKNGYKFSPSFKADKLLLFGSTLEPVKFSIKEKKLSSRVIIVPEPDERGKRYILDTLYESEKIQNLNKNLRTLKSLPFEIYHDKDLDDRCIVSSSIKPLKYTVKKLIFLR